MDASSQSAFTMYSPGKVHAHGVPSPDASHPGVGMPAMWSHFFASTLFEVRNMASAEAPV